MNSYLNYLFDLLLNDLSLLKDDQDAQNVLSIIKAFRTYNEKEIAPALITLNKLCENKLNNKINKYAHFLLATCYKIGFGIDENPEKAYKHYEISAKLKYIHGMRGLALCKMDGIGIKNNEKIIEEGFKLLLEAVKLQDSFSMVELAELYDEDQISQLPPEEIEIRFKLLSSDSDFSSKRIGLLKTAYQLDNPRAAYELISLSNDQNLDKLFSLSKNKFEYCLKAAKYYPEPMFQVGVYYFKGEKVPQDLNKSKEYFNNAKTILKAEIDENPSKSKISIEKIMLINKYLTDIENKLFVNNLDLTRNPSVKKATTPQNAITPQNTTSAPATTPQFEKSKDSSTEQEFQNLKNRHVQMIDEFSKQLEKFKAM